MKRFRERNTLVNLNNYGPYAAIASEDEFTIHTTDITKENWRLHFTGILNILKDGIYTERIQGYMITIVFANGMDVELSIIDYWFNLVMWYLLVMTDMTIEPKHIFFQDELKADSIKHYIDLYFINENRSKFNNRMLNNIIADMLQCYHEIDAFAPFLCNTLNLEDTAELMLKDPEFNECMTADFAGVPMDAVKGVGMQYANKSIDCIKRAKDILGHDHCLADAWRASEGINAKQYKEFTINIGTKPDGHGGIFPHIINKSFINGGVVDPIDYFIESSTGRIAQIIKFNNVSSSGTFARILGLNNMDSFIYPDTEYDCGTKHMLPVEVRSDEFLRHLNLLYYREQPMGIERKINYWEDKHLIGKRIWVRTPITCASAARGDGVCFKCYGDLAYTIMNIDEGISINIGRIAAEYMTAILTQMQLSVKHLLEAMIDRITWCDDFERFFDLNANVVQVSSEIDNYKDLRLLIDPSNIEMESDDVADVSEDDDASAAMNFNEYVTEFDVLRVSTGEIMHISNDRAESLYITMELNAAIRKKGEPSEDEMIMVPFTDLRDIPLFVLVLQNNEITKTLNKMKRLYNKADQIKGKTLEQLFQDILDTNIEGNLGVSAVHYALMLMNQVRSTEDVFETPRWDTVDPRYRILTLNESLNMSRSITISLSYQKITPMFYSPLTYKKHGASFMDLFFMRTPQRVIRGIDDEPIPVQRKEGEVWDPIVFGEDPNVITKSNPVDVDVIMDSDE